MKVVINSPWPFSSFWCTPVLFSKNPQEVCKILEFCVTHICIAQTQRSCTTCALPIFRYCHAMSCFLFIYWYVSPSVFCLYLCVFPPISPLSRFSFDAEVFCCLYINEVGEFCHSDTVGFTYHLMGGFTSSDTIETNREEEETALILFWVLHCYFFRGYLNNLHTDMLKKIMKARKCHIENISISQCYDCYC